MSRIGSRWRIEMQTKDMKLCEYVSKAISDANLREPGTDLRIHLELVMHVYPLDYEIYVDPTASSGNIITVKMVI